MKVAPGQTWKRQSQDAIKINCDATWCRSTKRGGIGVIARNHNGEVVGGYHGLEVADNDEYLEAHVVYEGIRLAVENRSGEVVIESEAASVINPIR